MEGHIGDEKEDKPRSQNKRLRELSGHCRALVTRVHTRNCNHFLRTCQAWGSFKKHIQFSRTTYVSHIVQKCTFPVHSNRTERLELFAPPQLLRIFQFTCFILIVNYCTKQKKNALCKSPSTSLSYDLYSVLDNQKEPKTLFRQLHSKLKNIYGLAKEFKDFSRTSLQFKDFSCLIEPC